MHARFFAPLAALIVWQRDDDGIRRRAHGM